MIRLNRIVRLSVSLVAKPRRAFQDVAFDEAYDTHLSRVVVFARPSDFPNSFPPDSLVIVDASESAKILRSSIQAALAFATWVAIASIRAGDRQS